MKRCSTCNRTYDDPNLSFCIDDGTPLTPVENEDDTTVVRPRNTERNTEDNDWNAQAYHPPGSYVPPSTEPQRRRVWPWVLGVVGAFVLGIVALSIAAAILIPRMTRGRQSQPPPVSNTNREENANVVTENSSNSNSDEHVNTPPPSDHEQVLGQLTTIEQEWTVANINADKRKLDRILADDFVGQGEHDEPQSKADYIRTIERTTDVDKWEFSDLKLDLTGDRAKLTGIITYFVNDRSVSFDFTDKFVWRDGRWQATGAEIKRRGNPETDL
jgi:Domain of unknown function (DUF4440)